MGTDSLRMADVVLISISPDATREGWYRVYELANHYENQGGEFGFTDVGLAVTTLSDYEKPIYIGSFDRAAYWAGIIALGLEENERAQEIARLIHENNDLKARLYALGMEKALGKQA